MVFNSVSSCVFANFAAMRCRINSRFCLGGWCVAFCIDVVEEKVIVVCKQGVSVGLVPLMFLIGECGVFRSFVVVLLLVEEFVAVLPERFEEIHPYHVL